MKSEDANFEMVTSNTIQHLNLRYQHNIVNKAVAHIFVNTYLENEELPVWDDAENRGEITRKLYREVLQFPEANVHVYKDESKEFIIRKMNELHLASLQFENEKREDEGTLLICVSWIGHTFYFDKDNWHYETKQFISRHYGSLEPPEDSPLFQEWFAITTENKPICLLEYCDQIAA